MLTNSKLEIALSMFSYTLHGNISHLWKIANPSMEMQNNPLWKKGTFSKVGFLLKITQKPYFFPYGKWLIFPVPHQTDPDSDVTPLPQ